MIRIVNPRHLRRDRLPLSRRRINKTHGYLVSERGTTTAPFNYPYRGQRPFATGRHATVNDTSPDDMCSIEMLRHQLLYFVSQKLSYSLF